MSKFKVGDKVKVVKNGWGYGPSSIGQTEEITKVSSNVDAEGRHQYNTFNRNNIHENSFELFELVVDFKPVEKPYSEVPTGGIFYIKDKRKLCTILKDGTAVRLGNVSLGYTQDVAITEKVTHIEGLTYKNVYDSLLELGGII